MRPPILVAALLVPFAADAFQASRPNKDFIEPLCMTKKPIGNDVEVGINLNNRRRSFVKNGMAVIFGVSGQVFHPEFATAGLLDEYGADPSKIKDADGEKLKATAAGTVSKKVESNLEPNLRSNYYYPTNKKRYLPRIKRCNDAIPEVATMIGNGEWEQLDVFCTKIAEDTILPMKLYTSSLLGGGTNVKVAFAKDMNQATKDFETSLKKLQKAIGKKDQQKSSQALEGLATALLAYRTAGRLLGPDGGGDIPSVDDIRRSASRTQKGFEAGIKERDNRVKGSL